MLSYKKESRYIVQSAVTFLDNESIEYHRNWMSKQLPIERESINRKYLCHRNER